MKYVVNGGADDQYKFSYDVNSLNGPDHWGKIRSEWSLCNTGDMQSPIDLIDERVQRTSKLGRLDTHYKPANATLINRGYDMTLTWIGGAGHIHINGTKYQLNQAHWHTPTEHSINGQRFNLELHLVHQSTNDKFAVVGVLYKLGHNDSFIAKIEPYLQALASTKGVNKSVGIIDPRVIKIGNSTEYYRYMGSLTTPACDEGVIWTIVRKVRTVSQEQVRIIREALDDEANGNARPIQPLNNRWVKLYIPHNHKTN
ncbi:hypothetical protein M8C21_009782 [Ambrosia artemisiifolia]|uniref:Alpha-carbonic anhydrase domain-containing protein n=1 Tax=Ambrosia artemisiifolia TaxID=4212 RepID=A0AAD5GPE8_AMBAR|nr:hypothetical protein M8C21_009782 [Ambrosia artemisiifolia]